MERDGIDLKKSAAFEARKIEKDEFDIVGGIDLIQSAKFLGIGMTKMRELEKQPDFPSYTVGRKILVSFDQLKAWQQRQIDLYKDEKNSLITDRKGDH